MKCMAFGAQGDVAKFTFTPRTPAAERAPRRAAGEQDERSGERDGQVAESSCRTAFSALMKQELSY